MNAAYVPPVKPPRYPNNDFKSSGNMTADVLSFSKLNRTQLRVSYQDTYEMEYQKWSQLNATSW